MIELDRISQWVDWMRIDYAVTTIASYEWELRHLESAHPGRAVESLTRFDLARYLAERRLHGAGDATIRRSVNALKAFYLFAVGKKSPAESLPVPSVKRKRQRTLDAGQAFEVLLSCDTSKPRGKRDLALVCLGLSSGLREAELCRLRIDEIDLERGRLTTRVKGGSDGDGVFGPDTASALSSWMAVRAGIAQPGVETVFVGVGGIKPGSPLTPSGMRTIFRRIAADAGLDHLSPHDLRRSFATLSHRFGAPTRIVQVAGRWNDIAQVERYTQALDQADFAKYDPVSHLMRDEPDS